MGYPIVNGNGIYPLIFFMRDSTTGQGKTGLSPTVVIRKQNGSFATPIGAVSELGNGFYQVAPNATDAGPFGGAGPLALYATGSGADAAAEIYPVVFHNPFSLFQSQANIAAFGGGFEADAYNQIFHYLHAAARAGTLLYDGFAVSGAAGSLTLDPIYRSTADGYYVDAQAVAYDGISGSPIASSTISAYSGLTGICTLSSGSMAGITSANWIEIHASKSAARTARLDPSGHVYIAAAGLDSITVETDVNARQALAGALAVAGGNISGAGPSGASTIVVKGANVAATRFTADCDGAGNRTVTFTPPA